MTLIGPFVAKMTKGPSCSILAYDIDILDGEASTPLICAACHDRPQLLRWLIDRGATSTIKIATASVPFIMWLNKKTNRLLKYS